MNMHGNAWERVGVHGNALDCAGMRGNAWAGMRKISRLTRHPLKHRFLLPGGGIPVRLLLLLLQHNAPPGGRNHIHSGRALVFVACGLLFLVCCVLFVGVGVGVVVPVV